NELLELSPNRYLFRNAAGEPRILRSEAGRISNPYASGWALLTLPPFILTHLVCRLAAPDSATGYSTPYDLVVALWHGLLAFGGLVLAAACAMRLSDEASAAVAAVGALFATNVAYYAYVDPVMSHAA